MQTCAFGAVGWVAGLAEAAFFTVVNGEEDEVADFEVFVLDAFADCERGREVSWLVGSSQTVVGIGDLICAYLLALIVPAPSWPKTAGSLVACMSPCCITRSWQF